MPSAANGSSLTQRDEPAGGKKKFLSPVFIFLNILCLRKMVEKWYLEFRGVLCSVKLMLIVGLNYPILKQINLLGSAKNHKIGIISINRGRLGRGAEDVSLKNQELMS